jgi:MYXO-CTERM domain-containing protein
MKTHASIVAVGCAVAALSISTLAGTARASIIIDDFMSVEDPNAWPIELNSAGTHTLIESGLTTLGGWRETFVEAVNLGDPVDSIEVNIHTGAGVFGFFSSSDASGFVSLFYDGGGTLSADFSQQTAIEVHFVLFDFANQNPLPITVSLSDGVNTATHTIALTSAGAQVATFLIADFINIGLIDLSSIASIMFEFDPGIAADFQLGAIVTVPAPGAFALLGLAGIIGSRRRRN